MIDKDYEALDLPEEITRRFKEYCEEREWIPVIDRNEDECVISFVSQEPEVEFVVRARTLEMAVLRAII